MKLAIDALLGMAQGSAGSILEHLGFRVGGRVQRMCRGLGFMALKTICLTYLNAINYFQAASSVSQTEGGSWVAGCTGEMQDEGQFCESEARFSSYRTATG